MADSKKRKDRDAQAKYEDEQVAKTWTEGIPLSPRWWAPTFITLLILGLLWLVVSYFSGMQFPIPGFNYWNLWIGIGIMLVGFFMTLRWR